LGRRERIFSEPLSFAEKRIVISHKPDYGLPSSLFSEPHKGDRTPGFNFLESFGHQPKTYPFPGAPNPAASRRIPSVTDQVISKAAIDVYIQIFLIRDLTFLGGVAHLSWALHACFRHLSNNSSSVLARMVKSQSDLKSLQLSSLYSSRVSTMAQPSFLSFYKSNHWKAGPQTR
jgi:hypothetical protein